MSRADTVPAKQIAREQRPMIDSPYGRSVEEWRSDNPDAMPPDHVRTRVFDRKEGRCHKCRRKIRAGEKWTLEHLSAIINGGKNRESNFDLTCCNCLPEKNAEDQALKSDTYDKRRKHILPKEPGRGFWKPKDTKFNWRTGRYEREGA